MKSIILITAILIICGCTIRNHENETPVEKYEVKFLFKKENCSIYSFYDKGRHYFTNCGETISTKRKQAGKVISYNEENIGGAK